ncbi:unnamed protein product [Paramecium sonneborni]|uniref:Autophagy-related protein n=1 Tax=Paramecium sonneborni TaxID=65129 RepID=A0A8S1L8H4_9CILI|nr:unnamed protein product [Paramecium sonneborni]
MYVQTKSQFKVNHSLEERKRIYSKKQIIHPTKILIILEQFIDNSASYQLCLADPDQLMINFEAEMNQQIKKKIPKAKNISLFFFINKALPQKDFTMGQLQQKMQDKEDGFLYVQVKSLETLGSLY